MAVKNTRSKINPLLDQESDHIAGRRSRKATEASVKDLLKGGTPAWASFPNDFKALAQDEFSRQKELSDKQVAQYKLPGQEQFTDIARKVNRMTLRDFQDKLKRNGLFVWSVESPRHDGSGGLWALVPTTKGKQPVFLTSVQYPAMYEWSILREDDHNLPDGEESIGWRNAVAKLVELNIWSEDKVREVFGDPPIAAHTTRYRQTLWNHRNNRISKS